MKGLLHLPSLLESVVRLFKHPPAAFLVKTPPAFPAFESHPASFLLSRFSPFMGLQTVIRSAFNLLLEFHFPSLCQPLGIFPNFWATEKWLLYFSQEVHRWLCKGQFLDFSAINVTSTEVNSKIKLYILWLCCLMIGWQEPVQAGILSSAPGSDTQIQLDI